MNTQGVFLDRDGVITAEVYYAQWDEWEAPQCPEDVEFLPGALEALAALAQSGIRLFLVSNQGAYAKGKVPLQNLLAVQRRVERELSQQEVSLAESFYSFTHPKGSVPGFSGQSLERKPGPYFLLLAAARHGLDLSRCWMIGDRDTDVQCGKSAGVRTIQVHNPHAGKNAGSGSPDFHAADLSQAARIILGNQ